MFCFSWIVLLSSCCAAVVESFRPSSSEVWLERFSHPFQCGWLLAFKHPTPIHDNGASNRASTTKSWLEIDAAFKLSISATKIRFAGKRFFSLWMLPRPWSMFKKSFTKCKFDKIDLIQYVLYIIRVIHCRSKIVL